MSIISRSILALASALCLFSAPLSAAPSPGAEKTPVNQVDCCRPGADCCKPGSDCCGSKQASSAKSSGAQAKGACCEPGADCCKAGSGCCK